jgi:hypothetical protein
MGTAKINHYDKLDLIVVTFAGNVLYPEIRDAMDKGYKAAITRYALIDLTAADVSKLTREELNLLSEQSIENGKKRGGCFDLMVVPGIMQYTMATLYTAYCFAKSRNSAQTKLFRDKAEALNWIKINETNAGRP